MELTNKLNEISARIEANRDNVHTEEAVKNAFIMPFLQAIGYDVFNPAEVIPEYTADHGVKKGEKVDYAIKLEGKIEILIECKKSGEDLTAKHASQLFRYFSVVDARFGVLTDGIKYVFFSDLDNRNKMDSRPFFVFNLLKYSNSDVDELGKFTKDAFNLETIISTANNLKYHRALLGIVRQEFDQPSDEIVKHFTAQVYEGKITQKVKEQFSVLTKKALKDFIRNEVNEKLKTALDRNSSNEIDIEENNEAINDSGIVTTQEEIDAYLIIKAIAADLIDPDRVFMRDAKSYCAIILDNSNRKTICRLYFGVNKMTIGIFNNGEQTKVKIGKISDIYHRRMMILTAIGSIDENIK